MSYGFHIQHGCNWRRTIGRPSLLSCHLIHWYQNEYGHYIDDYTETNLRVIASFYGNEKLTQEYQGEKNDLWDAVEHPEDPELQDIGGMDLSDTQWGYGEAVETSCSDISDLFDLNKLFKLEKEKRRTQKSLIQRNTHIGS